MVAFRPEQCFRWTRAPERTDGQALGTGISFGQGGHQPHTVCQATEGNPAGHSSFLQSRCSFLASNLSRRLTGENTETVSYFSIRLHALVTRSRSWEILCFPWPWSVSLGPLLATCHMHRGFLCLSPPTAASQKEWVEGEFELRKRTLPPSVPPAEAGFRLLCGCTSASLGSNTRVRGRLAIPILLPSPSPLATGHRNDEFV